MLLTFSQGYDATWIGGTTSDGKWIVLAMDRRRNCETSIAYACLKVISKPYFEKGKICTTFTSVPKLFEITSTVLFPKKKPKPFFPRSFHLYLLILTPFVIYKNDNVIRFAF